MPLSQNYNVPLTTSASPPTTDTTLFDQSVDGNPCMVFVVTNRSTSSSYAFVNCVGLHPAGYYAPIAPGETAVFRAGQISGITKVTGYAGSTATVDTKVTARV